MPLRFNTPVWVVVVVVVVVYRVWQSCQFEAATDQYQLGTHTCIHGSFAIAGRGGRDSAREAPETSLSAELREGDTQEESEKGLTTHCRSKL